MKVNENEILKDMVELQKGYQQLTDSRKFTKRNLCELCVPFRDKYKLTDSKTLQIARDELSLSDVVKLIEEIDEQCQQQ